MRIAIEAAKFTSEEANGLRRAMATFRNVGTIGKFESKMVNNMIARGYDPAFAKSCFDQIKGFGSYGFPESHAASFAQLRLCFVMAEAFPIPMRFCCGLLNSQPMGFLCAGADRRRRARERRRGARDRCVLQLRPEYAGGEKRGPSRRAARLSPDRRIQMGRSG